MANVKHLPCICGRTRLQKQVKRDESIVSISIKFLLWQYKCPVCGRASGWVQAESRLSEAWNNMIEREENGKIR